MFWNVLGAGGKGVRGGEKKEGPSLLPAEAVGEVSSGETDPPTERLMAEGVSARKQNQLMPCSDGMSGARAPACQAHGPFHDLRG